MGINFFDISEIKTVDTRRYSSCIEDFDWLYGTNPKEKNKGFPAGAITLCGGEAGVGKTRIWTSICHKMMCEGWKILYFSLEMSIFQFKGNYLKNKKIFPGFFLCSVEYGIDDICDIIKESNPHLVIVDSVNCIDCFNGGRGTNEIQTKIRNTINNVGSHIVFLAHLNQDRTIKGGTNLPHMGDIVIKCCNSKDFPDPRCVEVSIGKTRYGESGRVVLFRHDSDGIECVTENWRRSPDDNGIYFKGHGTVENMIMDLLKK